MKCSDEWRKYLTIPAAMVAVAARLSGVGGPIKEQRKHVVTAVVSAAKRKYLSALQHEWW